MDYLELRFRSRLISKCLVDFKRAAVLWAIEIKLVFSEGPLFTSDLKFLIIVKQWNRSADNSLPWLPPKSHVWLKRVAFGDQWHRLRDALNLLLMLAEELVEFLRHLSL